MNKTIILLMVLILTACGTLPIAKLNSTIEKQKQQFRVRLESKGQIAILQKTGKTGCSNFKKKLKVTIKVPNNKKENLIVKYSCDILPNNLVAFSKSLPKGLYIVRVEGGEMPVAAVNYEDPDFKLNKNNIHLRAQELVDSKTVTGNVNPSQGRASDWVALKNKGGHMSVILTSESPDEVRGTLYAMPKGAKVPHRIGFISPSKKTSISADQGDIYVQISGRKYSGEVKYALSRKDMTSAKSVAVPVIDCYPVSTNQSIVLLNPTTSIKVNDELSISAKKGNGETILLGKCIVGSISDSQASCRLNSTVTKDLTRFKAEMIKEG